MSDVSQLPAVLSETELETFDGWGAGDLLTWLTAAVAELAHIEKRVDAYRLNVGHGLYLLRDVLPEGEYGRTEEQLATQAGVSPRTLRRWRAAYEASRRLPPPEKARVRAEAQRARRTSAKRPKTAEMAPAAPIEASAEQVPNRELDLEASASAPALQPSAKDEDKAVLAAIRDLLRVDVTVAARAAKRSVLIEVEGWAKRAQQADADDGSRLVLLAPDVVSRLRPQPHEQWDAGVSRLVRDLLSTTAKPAAPTPGASLKKRGQPAVARTAPAPAAAKPATRPVTTRRVDEVAEADCKAGKHPLGRRLGQGCGACGKMNAWDSDQKKSSS